MTEYMNKESGFLGLSGIGSDNRDITAAAEAGNDRAKIVGEIFCYQIKKFIGSYAAAMNGLDAVIFTGGIGENAPDIRARACSNLDLFGLKIDDEANVARGKLTKISTEDSKTQVWVIPTNEELLIARDTLDLISNK